MCARTTEVRKPCSSTEWVPAARSSIRFVSSDRRRIRARLASASASRDAFVRRAPMTGERGDRVEVGLRAVRELEGRELWPQARRREIPAHPVLQPDDPVDANPRLAPDPPRGIDGDVDEAAAGRMVERGVEVERRAPRVEDGGDDALFSGWSTGVVDVHPWQEWHQFAPPQHGVACAPSDPGVCQLLAGDHS